MKLPVRFSRSLPLAVLIVLSLWPVRADSQEEPAVVELPRNTAIGMAIRHNIDLRIRALDTSIAETQVEGSTSIYDPYLTASVDFARTLVAGETFGTETTSGNVAVSQKLPTGATVSLFSRTGPISAHADPLFDYTDWSSAVGITVYQPLLKNAGKMATEQGILESRYAYSRALERFRDDVIDTVFEVITEYNRLYVLYQLLESRESAVQTAQQLLKELKEKTNQDDNTSIELSNTEYSLSQRQTELIEAQRQVRSKEADLLYLIGVEDRIHIIPVDAPSREEPPETEEQAIALAIEQRPDLEMLRIQLESNQVAEKVSRRNLWPDLALTASGGYRGYAEDGGFSDTVTQIGDGKGEYWSLGMRFSYPLGNDRAESDYRRSRIRSEQLENQLRAEEWKIRDDIQEDNRDLISARLRLQSTVKSRTLAEQRVAQYQKQVRSGTAPVKDLLDAENDLINVRNQELIAVENFAYLVARLWKDIGVLLERQNVHIQINQPEEITSGEPPLFPSAENGGVQDRQELEDHPVVSSPPQPEADMDNVESAVAGDADGAGITEVPREGHTEPPGQPVLAGVDPPQLADVFPAGKSYTLQVGNVGGPELAAVKNKIIQAGLVPVVNQGPKDETPVFRLFIGEHRNRQDAVDLLERLRIVDSGGFVLKNASGQYNAYAGSYFTRESAEMGEQRLADRGIQVTVREVVVAMPRFIITAGSFSSFQAAEKQSRILEKQGLDIRILQSGS